MFFVRRAIWLLRLYTNVLLVGVMVVAVDVDMQARAAGRDISSYDRVAYLQTLQRRLRGEVTADLMTPLDATMMGYRGVLQARLALLGGAPTQQAALMPEPRAPLPLMPQPQVQPLDVAEEAPSKPCVRRNNVLNC